MKKIVFLFILVNTLAFSEERLNWDIFLGHDIYGFAQIDRVNIIKDYDKYSFNVKTDISYKIYKSMDFLVGLGYESFFMPEYDDSYSIVPLTFGIRYMDNSKKIKPYIGLLYGGNILSNEEKFLITTEKNGYGEISIGILNKDKYFTEISYKHHAFAYSPYWPSNKYWNGKMFGINFGYRLK